MERKTGRVEVGKPRSETELLGRVGRQVPKQLRHPVFEEIVERSAQHSMVKVLRLDPFPNKPFGRHPLEKLTCAPESHYAPFIKYKYKLKVNLQEM